MPIQPVPVLAGRVTTEGDDLYYEVRGQGPPLLFIPGGGGDGRWYAFVADILAGEYRVITYDRRANARSTGRPPQNFDIHQQSRDAVAVLRAAGAQAAFVFGNSSGAIIALDLAQTQPQAVRVVVAHEPPLARVHPRAKQWQRFFAGVYWLAFRFGVPVAMIRFTFGVGLPVRELVQTSAKLEPLRAQQGERGGPSGNSDDYFVKQELLPVTNHLPDVGRIKANGVRVFLAAGRQSLAKKRFYAQTAPILARMLECELVLFPGHHVSYLDMPEEWAATLRRVLHKAAGDQSP